MTETIPEGLDSSAALHGREAVPLMQAEQGQELELARVEGGRSLAVRLANIGLTPGVRFRIESGGRTGPVIICIGASRLILGHGMAHRIFVRPVKQERP